jgi:uncharacterized protein YjbJ (UPF0337 family)
MPVRPEVTRLRTGQFAVRRILHPDPGVIARKVRRQKEMAMGAASKAAHKVQAMTRNVEEAVGRSSGDRALEAEGRVDRASGDLKQAGDKVKDAVRRD